MRKLKKTLLAATLCLVLVVSCIASAFASVNVNGFQCGVCGMGTVTVTTTTKDGVAQVRCCHGYEAGWDYWYGYLTTETSQCGVCGDSSVYSYFTKTALLACEGANTEVVSVD